MSELKIVMQPNCGEIEIIENSKSHLVPVTKIEADLLRIFLLNMGQLISRDKSMEGIWRFKDYYSKRSMDVYVCRLRKKFREYLNIRAIHGKGHIVESAYSIYLKNFD